MGFIFQFPLAILKLCESEILQMDFEEMTDFLHKFSKGCNSEDSVLPPTEIIIKKANEIKISEKRLNITKDMYHT
jgi:hypothetical protein